MSKAAVATDKKAHKFTVTKRTVFLFALLMLFALIFYFNYALIDYYLIWSEDLKASLYSRLIISKISEQYDKIYRLENSAKRLPCLLTRIDILKTEFDNLTTERNFDREALGKDWKKIESQYEFDSEGFLIREGQSDEKAETVVQEHESVKLPKKTYNEKKIELEKLNDENIKLVWEMIVETVNIKERKRRLEILKQAEDEYHDLSFRIVDGSRGEDFDETIRSLEDQIYILKRIPPGQYVKTSEKGKKKSNGKNEEVK